VLFSLGLSGMFTLMGGSPRLPGSCTTDRGLVQQGRHMTCPYGGLGWIALGWVVCQQGEHKARPYRGWVYGPGEGWYANRAAIVLRLPRKLV